METIGEHGFVDYYCSRELGFLRPTNFARRIYSSQVLSFLIILINLFFLYSLIILFVIYSLELAYQ